MDQNYDLIVIGGGPGGSTVATLVAMQGHKVLLLEREKLPVHKIGESLLPSTINGICAMLGVTEELGNANFVRKLGGTFLWGRSKEPWTFAFSMSSKMRGPTSFAYQVERMKFDLILLNNARQRGVDVRERHSVTELLVDDGRVSGVQFHDDEGRTGEARSRFTIDASGWATSFSRHVGTRVYSKFFRNVAVFAYYENGKRLPEPKSGNIFCVAFDRGWFWYIPLSDQLTSVGAVIGQEYSPILAKGTEAALSELIASCPAIAELLSDAERITSGPYGEVRVRKDYSYCHDKFWRPGLALIGDSACFIDPVFSSGVHLATYSALLAARTINSCLRDRLDEERAFNEFERRYLREYRYFYDFLVAFYNMEQDVESYYWAARNVLNSGDAANDAFIQLVAGIGGSGEQLFATPNDFLNRQADITDQLVSSSFGGAVGHDHVMPAGARPTPSPFLIGLLTEVTQVQRQAILKEHRPPERPLFDGGYVPSADGFHWAEPVK